MANRRKAISRNSRNDFARFQNADSRFVCDLSFDVFEIVGENVLENSDWNVQNIGNAIKFIASSAWFFIGRRRAGIEVFSGDEFARWRKLEFLSEILEAFTGKFEVVNMREHARRVQNENLKSLDYAKQAA